MTALHRALMLLLGGCALAPVPPSPVTPELALLAWDGSGTCDEELPEVRQAAPASVSKLCDYYRGGIRGCYSDGVIAVSDELAPLAARDTLAHELAHWLVDCGDYPAQVGDHGPVWRELYVMIVELAGD